MKSLFQLHKEKYAEGCGSDQCERAKNIVFCRGTVPCDVLFIGEAPGESEDVLGIPFVGPAGKLLNHIVRRSVGDAEFAMTNLVCCIPREDGDGKRKAGQPSPEQMMQCKERLEEFIRLCDPKLIVAVGALARDSLHQGYKHSVKVPGDVNVIDITHPAAILRASVAQQGIAVQRCIVTIQNAIADLEED